MNNLINKRLLTILLLGFSSGLPLVLTGATLQAWFTDADVNLKTIGAITLLGLPYTFKFLWAPLMDYYGLSRLGKRKSWILLTQFALFLALMAISQLHPSSQAEMMGALAFVIAFLSASQDISINAYTTDVLHETERGLGAAYTVFAYRIALLVSGGLALIMADYIGWEKTYQCMAFLMLLSMIPTFFAPRAPTLVVSANNLYGMTKQAIADLMKRDHIFLLLCFIILYKIGDALALSLMTTFLMNGLGFTLTEIGAVYKTVSIIAMIAGGFVGGIILLRVSLYRALLVFGLAQAFSTLLFAVLAYLGKDFILMTFAVCMENFCSGLSTAALVAFIMSQCDQRYTASQFALFTGIASIGRVFLGPVAAWLVSDQGWLWFFIWSFVACFPGILCLLLLKREEYAHAQISMD